MKKIDESRNYFLEEIEQNELMSKKHRNVYITQNYTTYFFILAFTVTLRVSISAFAFFA